MMFPLVSFGPIDLSTTNELLARWNHRIGPIHRPQFGAGDICYALYHEQDPVAVAVMSTLIRDHVGGGLAHLTRENTCELSRLCACRPGLCRVALRLWREFVFAPSSYTFAVSYQDADMHTGNTYRFDGWRCVASVRSGGVDERTGRRGRNRRIWIWPPDIGDLAPPADSAIGGAGPGR